MEQLYVTNTCIVTHQKLTCTLTNKQTKKLQRKTLDKLKEGVKLENNLLKNPTDWNEMYVP